MISKESIKVLIFLVLPFVLTLNAGDFRKFTSEKGVAIKAELLAASDSAVTLKRIDGVIFRDVPIERFSEYDRHYIEVWTSKFNNSGSPPLYRVEIGGSKCINKCYSAKGTRYYLNGSGTLVIVPGQVCHRSDRRFENCYGSRHGSGTMMYENRGNRLIFIKSP